MKRSDMSRRTNIPQISILASPASQVREPNAPGLGVAKAQNTDIKHTNSDFTSEPDSKRRRKTITKETAMNLTRI